MNKYEYLAEPVVDEFVSWLTENFTRRTFHLNVPNSRFVNRAVQKQAVGVQELLENYMWKSYWMHPVTGRKIESHDWFSTKQSIERLGVGVRDAIRENNNSLCLSWCLSILQWGGVHGAIPFLRNLSIKGELVDYLESTAYLFNIDNATEERDINESSILRFDAGLTKIHAFVDLTGSPIYDSRVGAAISMFSALFSAETTKESPLLIFPAGDARGQQYRNPSDLGYDAAPKFYTSRVSNVDWAISQLRLGWIIREVVRRDHRIFSEYDSEAEKMHAVQAALFMAGYDLRCFEFPDSSCKSTASENIADPNCGPLRNMVPTVHSLQKVSELLANYHTENHSYPRCHQDFIGWQVGKEIKEGTARSNCYPLRQNEFDIYNRSELEINLLLGGGYQSLLDGVGHISPSPDERENICLACVYFAGQLRRKFSVPAERVKCLIGLGAAGNANAAGNILSVGHSVGRHFDLLDCENNPTANFDHYFREDDWGWLMSGCEGDVCHLCGWAA